MPHLARKRPRPVVAASAVAVFTALSACALTGAGYSTGPTALQVTLLLVGSLLAGLLTLAGTARADIGSQKKTLMSV